HTGSAVTRDGDWYGSGVNVASRLCSAAGGGDVLVSDATREAAGVARWVEFGERQLHWLKNVPEPVAARSASATQCSHSARRPLRKPARIEEIERVIASEGTTAEKAQRAGDDFTQMIVADSEWQRLFFEFSAYAARNDEFREELVTRYRAMRDRVAAALRARGQAAGLD